MIAIVDYGMGNLLSVKNALDYLGEDTLVYSVSDGEYTVESTVDITVEQVNDAPILTEIPVIEFLEDTDTTIVLDAFDVDENSYK